MRLVSENKKMTVIKCQLIVITPTVSCAKILLSESIAIGLQNMTNVLLGVPKKVVSWFLIVFWLVLDKGY